VGLAGDSAKVNILRTAGIPFHRIVKIKRYD